jgi:hypothetical protein
MLSRLVFPILFDGFWREAISYITTPAIVAMILTLEWLTALA